MILRRLIVVAGSMARKPDHGGHTWVFLQYLLGFRQLGWDVLFLDALPPDECTDAAGNVCPHGESRQVGFVRTVMARFGLEDDWAVLLGSSETAGLPRTEVLDRVRRAEFLLNVMGFLRDEEMLASVSRRVFLDIDPGFGQMWKALGLVDVFRNHDAFVTIGENIGGPACQVPTCGLDWITTPQPVVLEHWPVADNPTPERFTAVASWRGAYGPVEYEGRVYGLRVHEFRRFVDLPGRTKTRFELAMDIHSDETKDLEMLAVHGWDLVNPRVVAGDPWVYRDYICESWAEFLVAKGMYVQSRCGWLSDRSLCYLASGRPVLAQDTGITDLYPTGEGLVTFIDPDDAADGVDSLRTDYPRHARAARQLAEEYFASDTVLGNLLSRLGFA